MPLNWQEYYFKYSTRLQLLRIHRLFFLSAWFQLFSGTQVFWYCIHHWFCIFPINRQQIAFGASMLESIFVAIECLIEDSHILLALLNVGSKTLSRQFYGNVDGFCNFLLFLESYL